jgi:hypothetical protein
MAALFMEGGDALPSSRDISFQNQGFYYKLAVGKPRCGTKQKSDRYDPFICTGDENIVFSYFLIVHAQQIFCPLLAAQENIQIEYLICQSKIENLSLGD